MGRDPSLAAVSKLYCDLLVTVLASKDQRLVRTAIAQLSTTSFSPVAELDGKTGSEIGEVLFRYCSQLPNQIADWKDCSPFIVTYNLNLLLDKLLAFEFPKSYSMTDEEFACAERKIIDGYVALLLLAQEPDFTQAKLSQKQRDLLHERLCDFTTLWLNQREMIWCKWREEVFPSALKLLYATTKRSTLEQPQLFSRLEKWTAFAYRSNLLPLLLDTLRNCSPRQFEQFIKQQLEIIQTSQEQQQVLIALTCYAQLRPLTEELLSSISTRFKDSLHSSLATILMQKHQQLLQ